MLTTEFDMKLHQGIGKYYQILPKEWQNGGLQRWGFSLSIFLISVIFIWIPPATMGYGTDYCVNICMP